MLKAFTVLSGTLRFLTSMSLGLALLSIIIVFSILGTFNSGIFATPWFLTLSAFLTFNMLGCTALRMKGFFKKEGQVPKVLQRVGQHRQLTLVEYPVGQASSETKKELRRLGFRVGQSAVGDSQLVIGKKNHWALLGSPLLHLSMIFVIIGSVMGSIWGAEKYVQVEVPGQVKLTQQGFPFDLQIKKFHMDTYEDGSPKQYTSLLDLISANQSKLEKAVSVNHPLSYQGVKIYQTSYGYNLQGAVREEKHSFDFKMEEGERIFLGGPGQFELAVQWPRYYVYSKGIPFTMGIAELGEPIKLLNLEVVLTNRIPYTGLQIKKDPGLPFIWLGFGLFLVALPMRFFVKSNQIWLLLSQTAEGVEIRLAAQHRVRGKAQEDQLVQKLSGLKQRECSLQS